MSTPMAQTRSVVVLSVQGDVVGSVENPLPSRDGVTRMEPEQDDETDRKEKRSRRSQLWECFSVNAFKSKWQKSKELTSQLQHEEAHCSSKSVSVPCEPNSGPQTASMQPPQSRRESLLRHEGQLTDQDLENPPSRRYSWNQSGSSPRRNSLFGKIDVKTNGERKKTAQEVALGMRWEEFKAELKSLFWDLVEYAKAKTWKKKILTVLVFLVACWVFYDLLFGRQDFIITWLHAFIVWMTGHQMAAVFAFVGIFTLSTLAFVPPTLLVFGAGYAFTVALDSAVVGVTAAVFACFLGSCLGAVIAFLRSRYMMRDLVKLFATRYPLVGAIDEALKVRHGFWIMLLLRLCPIIPFNALNYCCGITGVTVTHFILSLVGILPFQIFTTIVGATARAFELESLKVEEYTTAEKWTFVGLVIAGILFVIVAIVYGWRLVKEYLRQELSMSDDEFECILRSDASSSAFSFRLSQTGGDASLGDLSQRSSERSATPFQEKDEEWFWVWA